MTLLVAIRVDICGVKRKNYGSDGDLKKTKTESTINGEGESRETRVLTFPGVRSEHGRLLHARVGRHVTRKRLERPGIALGSRRREARIRNI